MCGPVLRNKGSLTGAIELEAWPQNRTTICENLRTDKAGEMDASA